MIRLCLPEPQVTSESVATSPIFRLYHARTLYPGITRFHGASGRCLSLSFNLFACAFLEREVSLLPASRPARRRGAFPRRAQVRGERAGSRHAERLARLRASNSPQQNRPCQGGSLLSRQHAAQHPQTLASQGTEVKSQDQTPATIVIPAPELMTGDGGRAGFGRGRPDTAEMVQVAGATGPACS